MKRVVPLLLALLLLAGCGAAAEIDPLTMGPRLLEGAGFPDTMVPLEGPMLEALYQIDPDSLESWYGAVSGGATAEELLLLKAADEAEAQAIRDRLADHLADRTESFAAYLPAETEKLENAILELRGTAVVLCVCGDPEAARAILEEKG